MRSACLSITFAARRHTDVALDMVNALVVDLAFARGHAATGAGGVLEVLCALLANIAFRCSSHPFSASHVAVSPDIRVQHVSRKSWMGSLVLRSYRVHGSMIMLRRMRCRWKKSYCYWSWSWNGIGQAEGHVLPADPVLVAYM